jgi:hypothetical protein
MHVKVSVLHHIQGKEVSAAALTNERVPTLMMSFGEKLGLRGLGWLTLGGSGEYE